MNDNTVPIGDVYSDFRHLLILRFPPGFRRFFEHYSGTRYGNRYVSFRFRSDFGIYAEEKGMIFVLKKAKKKLIYTIIIDYFPLR